MGYKIISYTGKVSLINSVLRGIYGFWAKIIILLQEVITQVMIGICRNYLRGADSQFKKIPYGGWYEKCQPKTHGILGLKNLKAWNKACIAKLVWAVADKKDMLWVRWVHGRYLGRKD